MKRNRFTQEQIIGLLHEHKRGSLIKDICLRHEIELR